MFLLADSWWYDIHSGWFRNWVWCMECSVVKNFFAIIDGLSWSFFTKIGTWCFYQNTHHSLLPSSSSLLLVRWNLTLLPLPPTHHPFLLLHHSIPNSNLSYFYTQLNVFLHTAELGFLKQKTFKIPKLSLSTGWSSIFDQSPSSSFAWKKTSDRSGGDLNF